MKDPLSDSPTKKASDSYTTITVEKKSPKPIKLESEDATFARGGILIVADGVSRNHYDKDTASSPAAKASKIAVAVMGSILQDISQDEPITREVFQKAFTRANEAIQTVNRDEEYTDEDGTITTLWDKPNFFERDLAGTVAAAVVRRGNIVNYGFVGDCRILLVSPGGNITWESLTPETNRVSQAQQVFDSPNVKQLPPKDDPNYSSEQIKYIQMVHQEYRNNPNTEHPTYGVLTGQPEAVDDQYLITGSVECGKNEVLVLTSDGLDGYFKDQSFKELVIKGTKEQIDAYIRSHPEFDTSKDDKALVISKLV